MNQETNAGTEEVQQEKAARNKRSRSSSKNRPVLVTDSSNDQVTDEQPVEETSEPVSPVEEAVPTTTVEEKHTRRFPKFFSSVGKNDKSATVEADQASARMARATRNSGTTSVKDSTTRETKPVPSTNTNKAAPKAAPARPQQRQGGFKTKYLYGLIIYVVVAMFVGHMREPSW